MQRLVDNISGASQGCGLLWSQQRLIGKSFFHDCVIRLIPLTIKGQNIDPLMNSMPIFGSRKTGDRWNSLSYHLLFATCYYYNLLADGLFFLLKEPVG